MRIYIFMYMMQLLYIVTIVLVLDETSGTSRFFALLQNMIHAHNFSHLRYSGLDLSGGWGFRPL